MFKGFPIDFIRQVLEQTFDEEHRKSPNDFYGGYSQLNLLSFYEQLQKEEEVDRYVEIYRDLVEQQNRTGLIMNGTIIAPENPTITNINQCLIIPMSFTCSFRVKLVDRDTAIDTINNVIQILKGRKHDVAQFDNGTLFKVGTIANKVNGEPNVDNANFIGKNESNVGSDKSYIENRLTELFLNGIGCSLENNDYLYYENYGGKLKTCQVSVHHHNLYAQMTFTETSENVGTRFYLYRDITTDDEFDILPLLKSTSMAIELTINNVSNSYTNESVEVVSSWLNIDGTWNIKLAYIFNKGTSENATYSGTVYGVDGTYDYYEVSVVEDVGDDDNIFFPPEHESFEKYKLSISFDSIRCDEPRNLNAEEYCVISFGGSATLTSKYVMLGNDLTKLSIQKKLIKAQTDITIYDKRYWLEPLELPSSNSADTQINQLLSNKFITNTHTDNISVSNQYTFILDKKISLLNQLFKYARYGTQANGTDIPYENGVSPNMIYEVNEVWSSWGEVEIIPFKTKIVESIDVENTESDTLTITIPLQVQGDNN